MISGSCLCGSVRFEADQFSGPFELCHCNRCRKTTGSAFAPMIGVKSSHFRWMSGKELIKCYEAPVIIEDTLPKLNREQLYHLRHKSSSE